ncbi:c-type cytochrome [Cyclobacterium sp. 1_MG-2023]|uniref:PVC-type heme-binding CxxCH protein n=1 Tax=Cyclobacterium sp. 1_MG-2023 TaxID=3062681 RepID=UPI0026E246E1|nr:PVC-type heme-binding CxxCH protein [Cyclobacterium sp. 1_MG-2023]MDO6439231.1 c-type cytochrome [Cyclobacterium sp. 1_MG-2023]
MKKTKFSHALIFLCLSGICLLQSCGGNSSGPSMKGSVSPKDAIATFELEPGFQMELIANEPLVSDPVDMEIDEFGRLYVVEMPGYPIDKSGTGRIVLLSDEDDDGVMDKSTVFADNLILPNGILRWKKGVLITDAPDVLYLEDTDGDGVADVREVVMTGFSLSNPHVNVNNPVYGLDNWIHLSHLGHIGTRKYEEEFGDKGTNIVFPNSPGSPELPKNANGHSVRFRPDIQVAELASTRSQFGHTYDRWGRYLLTHNQNHIYHEVIAAPYLSRNPGLLVSNSSESISDHGKETEVFQITTNPDRQLFTPVGLTTSSSGLTAYLGGTFPEPFENAVFVAESVSNLVHVDILKEKGATFIAERLRENKEFLASKDSWSRPVNMYVGPDGALYVLDYYRKIIEHPEWMSDEAVAAGGLYDGVGMGRIYRITPKGTGKADWTSGLTFGEESPKEWVKHLASKNNWWRNNAQRLIVTAQNQEVISDLEKMAKNKDSAEGRLHALWTLEGLKGLSTDLIIQALNDPVAGVRENAIKLSEMHLSESNELIDALLNLKTDPNARVRFQLLCTLGFIDTQEAAQVAEELLFQDLSDEWVQIAALSASSSKNTALLQTVLTRFDKDVPAYGSLVRRLTAMITANENEGEAEKLLQSALKLSENKGWEASVLYGIADGVKRNEENEKALTAYMDKVVLAFFDHPNAGLRKSALNLIKTLDFKDENLLKSSMDKAMAIASDQSIPEDRRAEALRFLPEGDVSPYADQLKGMIATTEPIVLQIAAMQALGNIKGTSVPEYVLSKWNSLTPEIRDVALGTFMSESERVKLLLEALKDGKIPTAAIGWKMRVRLMNNGDEATRNFARELLTKNEGEEINKKYQKALEINGDPIAGKSVYIENCALCHQFRGKGGVAFGPDLGTLHNWHPKDLMANILDPNLSIAPGFDLWEVTLKDGEIIQGMIMNETSAAISLRISPGIEQTINRQDIEAIKGMNMSLMPGLAGQLDQQKIADLMAFIRNSE